MKTLWLLFISTVLFSQILTENFNNLHRIDTDMARYYVFNTSYLSVSGEDDIRRDLIGTADLTAHNFSANYASETTTHTDPLYSGYMLTFNGSNQYFSENPLVLGTGDYTISFTINMADYSTGGDVYLGLQYTDGSNRFFLRIGGTGLPNAYLATGGNNPLWVISGNTIESQIANGTPVHITIVSDRDNTNVMYYNATSKTLTTNVVSADNANFAANLEIGKHNASYGAFSMSDFAIYNKALSLAEVYDDTWLNAGWSSLNGGVSRPSLNSQFQGVVNDTIYYDTALATGTWTISISDSAASAITYNILTSNDKGAWTQIGTDATSTTWQTSEFSGTGQGYFAIAVPSGTAYFDNVSITNTPSGQDKGFKEHSKFKRFKSLK